MRALIHSLPKCHGMSLSGRTHASQLSPAAQTSEKLVIDWLAPLEMWVSLYRPWVERWTSGLFPGHSFSLPRLSFYLPSSVKVREAHPGSWTVCPALPSILSRTQHWPDQQGTRPPGGHHSQTLCREQESLVRFCGTHRFLPFGVLHWEQRLKTNRKND